MTTKIDMLAIDLAKGSFQVFAVGLDGTVLYNRALSRTRLATRLTEQPTCIVAMEACATSHHWGRVAQSHGHEVRLVPAAYVKPFVKRQKNDRAEAEAIAEAALRPGQAIDEEQATRTSKFKAGTFRPGARALASL
jgi:transposase